MHPHRLFGGFARYQTCINHCCQSQHAFNNTINNQFCRSNPLYSEYTGVQDSPADLYESLSASSGRWVTGFKSGRKFL